MRQHCSNNERKAYLKDFNTLCVEIEYFREFDPGSGRTLAACLTHASRTEKER